MEHGRRRRAPAAASEDVGYAVRRWKDETIDGQRFRNVKFTEVENERLLMGVRAFCQERGLDEASLRERLRDERQKGKTWGRIALLCGVERRSVQALSKRLRRLLFGSVEWTLEKIEQLIEQVTLCGGTKPSWKQIGLSIGVSQEQCRDKWKQLCGQGRKGSWGAMEIWSLRQGVCELTNSLAPVSNIPWRLVRRWVPHRSSEQCRLAWYRTVLPSLLHYQDKNGVPLETDIFSRLIVGKLRKGDNADALDVNWQRVNGWWSASMNRAHWRQLERLLPREFEGADLRDAAEWLYEALECRRHRRRDKRVLEHARLMLEAEAEALSVSEPEEPEEPQQTRQARPDAGDGLGAPELELPDMALIRSSRGGKRKRQSGDSE